MGHTGKKRNSRSSSSSGNSTTGLNIKIRPFADHQNADKKSKHQNKDNGPDRTVQSLRNCVFNFCHSNFKKSVIHQISHAQYRNHEQHNPGDTTQVRYEFLLRFTGAAGLDFRRFLRPVNPRHTNLAGASRCFHNNFHGLISRRFGAGPIPAPFGRIIGRSSLDKSPARSVSPLKIDRATAAAIEQASSSVSKNIPCSG